MTPFLAPRPVAAAPRKSSTNGNPGVNPIKKGPGLLFCRIGPVISGAVDFALETSRSGERTVIAVSGDLDVLTAPQLRDQLIEAVEGGRRRLLVDLTGCTFVDSSGLSALVSGLKRLRSLQGDLELVCPPGNVRRLVELVALDQVFELYDSLEAAGA
jgi:anti-sigma B factor antagonist